MTRVTIKTTALTGTEDTEDTDDADTISVGERLMRSIADGLRSEDICERSAAAMSLRYLTIDDICDAWVSWGVTLSDIQHLSMTTSLICDELWDEERGNGTSHISSPYTTLAHTRYVCDQLLSTHDLYARLDDDDEWTQDDEDALREQESLIAYDDPTDNDIEAAAAVLSDDVSEWVEWIVLSGELERVTEDGQTIWVRVPNRAGGVDGEDVDMTQEEAAEIFDALDPMSLWFQERFAESQRGETPSIARRYEVELVCQVCSVDEETGIVCVRDDVMSRRKSFDVCDDTAAQRLCEALLKIL